ncbi:hypothetical protein CEXT_422341 [Caerostris extrusa]|uniref:Uncharacterized protein n=1 Tax=Caerostris extrusa TaxID=172846 RepID=A0AAV4U9F8_CAEEX|nr:hypothetical protein CEXT_422341 [Caerostris extrusa]
MSENAIRMGVEKTSRAFPTPQVPRSPVNCAMFSFRVESLEGENGSWFGISALAGAVVSNQTFSENTLPRHTLCATPPCGGSLRSVTCPRKGQTSHNSDPGKSTKNE